MSTSRRRHARGFVGLAASYLVVTASSAQQREAVPAFPARAEAITVDVVVLGKDGQPVRDLVSTDFTLFEDDRPQPVVGFERRVLKPQGETAQAALADETSAATNEADKRPPGRTLAFLVDDLGIEPLHMTEVARALSHWLAQASDPRDEVTVVTTSGDAWWSDTVGEGRADLEAVLGRIKGKRRLAAGQESLSDWEAYSIETVESPIAAPPPAATGPPTGAAVCTQASGASANVGDRVVDRWFRTGACLCQPMDIGASIRACRAQVHARATELSTASRQRAVGLLGGVERISRGLASARGRKSIVIFSEGLLRDTDRGAVDRAVDASRRGNTAVSFVDVRGLMGSSVYGVQEAAAPQPGDVGVRNVEQTLFETAGGGYIAETTGGTLVSNTNDLAAGVTRLADELSAYYLLGYQSDRPVDGKWHRLDVKVSRPGVTVRTRRGYFASAPEAPRRVVSGGKEEKKGKKKGNEGTLPVRSLDPALAVGGERNDVPLRLAPHVMDTDATGMTRVLVAVEVGTGAVAFAGTGGERKAQIDVTVLGVSRDQPKTVSLDSHVDLGVDARAVGGWWTFTRELRLPPGVGQIRALVRDTVSGRSGLVGARVVIPPSNAPHLSTPILSDSLRPAQGRAGSPRLLPVAHRRFRPHGQLYCAYEVYPAPGVPELSRIPEILGGYTVEDAEGRMVTSAPPTPIALALGAQITRMLSIPLDRLPPGRYRLAIQVADRVTGATFQSAEVFWVEGPASADSKAN